MQIMLVIKRLKTIAHCLHFFVSAFRHLSSGFYVVLSLMLHGFTAEC